MSYQVLVSAVAERDIIAAADYIEFALKNPAAANRLLKKVETRISSLSELPCRTRLLDDPVLASWGVRCVTVDNYLAFYVVSEPDRTVTVLRFLYQKSDWVQILRLG